MPNLLTYAIPWFILLMVIEIAISVKDKKNWYQTKDTITSITLGLGNFGIGILSKFVGIGFYTFLYQYRILNLSDTWWVWILAFFADDFSYYINHATSHNIRFFWASHKVHHSSEQYNLAAALRQTWTSTITFNYLFWAWMPLVGFSPLMILTMQAISLIYQYWIHTEAIIKLPKWIEYIFNTPSHHRVHHAININYLDKNHAGVLIIWDRVFGTFVQETEKPIYGLRENVNTFNPIKIAFHEWNLIIQSFKKSPIKYWHKYLFSAPGYSHDGSTKTTKELREEIN